MKKTITLSIIYFAMLGIVNATTITVDNNTESAAQYTNLQTAVDASQPGDTILVTGSVTSYGSLTTKKKIVLIGAGYAGLSSKLSYLGFENLTATDGSSDSYVSGFEISTLRFNTVYVNRVSTGFLSGIIVERCQISTVGYSNSADNYSNFILRNNIITSSNNFNLNNVKEASYSSILYANNIFSGGYFASSVSVSISNGVEFITSLESMSGVVMRNNIFIGSNTSAFNEVVGATVENNIFYGRTLIPLTAYNNLDTLQYNLNFNNNMSYLASQDLTLNSWFAVGANNIDANAQFVNFPPDGASFSIEHDYRLQAGSPGIGAGVNGEDLGIYGGAYPWPGDLVIFPKGPRVIELKPIGSPSVPAGGTLDVQFKSIINN